MPENSIALKGISGKRFVDSSFLYMFQNALPRTFHGYAVPSHTVLSEMEFRPIELRYITYDSPFTHYGLVEIVKSYFLTDGNLSNV